MKKILLHDWNIMRILRVVGGLALVFTAFIKHDTIVGAFGLLFIYQGVFNVQCCGLGGCSMSSCQTNDVDNKQNSNDFVDFEEIKQTIK